MCCFYVTHYSQKRITPNQLEQRCEGRLEGAVSSG